MLIVRPNYEHLSEVYGFEPDSKVPKIVDDDCNSVRKFTCKPKNKRISYAQCLEDYVNYNAYNIKDNACYNCPVGQHLRERYANDEPIVVKKGKNRPKTEIIIERLNKDIRKTVL